MSSIRVIQSSEEHLKRIQTLASRPDTSCIHLFTYNIFCGRNVAEGLKHLSRLTRVKLVIGLPDSRQLGRFGSITDFANDLKNKKLSIRWHTECHVKGVLASKSDRIGSSHTAIVGGHNLTLSSWKDVSVELSPVPPSLDRYFRKIWSSAKDFPKKQGLIINGKKV